MKPNWVMIVFWYNVFTNGFFISLTWLVIFTATITLILKLKGDI